MSVQHSEQVRAPGCEHCSEKLSSTLEAERRAAGGEAMGPLSVEHEDIGVVKPFRRLGGPGQRIVSRQHVHAPKPVGDEQYSPQINETWTGYIMPVSRKEVSMAGTRRRRVRGSSQNSAWRANQEDR